MIVKKCFALMLLKYALSFSMKMTLKTIVMNGIETYNWALDVFDNEEVHMNDDFASDEGDVLATKDLDVPTSDIGEGL